MNTTIRVVVTLLIQVTAIFLLVTRSAGHNEDIHRFITKGAFYSSDGINFFLSNQLDQGTYVIKAKPHGYDMSANKQPIKWLEWGSYYEDMEDPIILGLKDSPRAQDHFYTASPQRIPGRAVGLTDASETPFHQLAAHGTNSFVWGAMKGTMPVSLTKSNDQTWQNSRDYEIATLTNTTKIAREENLALMLDSLGHVLHLNQDLSSPDHVRNDNHYDEKHRFIENYGAVHWDERWFEEQTQKGWSYWQERGFTKILDFWDRGHYAGSAAALNADRDGNDKLGLAEFSNGNFLGEDALYAEFFPNHADKHYFPFPSLEHTDYRSKAAISGGTIVSYLENGKEINRYSVTKKKDGITVTNHSVLLYLGTEAAHKGMKVTQVASTINDPVVLREYHEKLIPKAVEYSAGLLDYFFRGTFAVGANWNDGMTYYTNQVINTSGQDFHGGAFYLLEENGSSERAILHEFPMTDILANRGISNLVYSTSMGTINPSYKHLVIYRGTIGYSGTQALDPVDENITIAVSNPHLGFQTVTNVFAGSYYSFGNYPAGNYGVRYKRGALRFNPDHKWFAINTDDRNGSITVDHSDGTDTAIFSETGEFDSQAEAEANSSGATVTFVHTGGEIRLHFSDDIDYTDNLDGSPNPTFELYRL